MRRLRRSWRAERRLSYTEILELTNACTVACSYCDDYEKFERANTPPA